MQKLLSTRLFTLFLFFLLTTGFLSGCGGGSSDSEPSEPNNPPTQPSETLFDLTLIQSYELDIPEPSGLSWALNGKDFYVVDDQDNQLYKIDKQGNILDDYLYSGDDVEGVTVDVQSQTIWIVEEAQSKIVQLDEVGNTIQSFRLDIERESNKNSLEGISSNSANNTFYVLNEDNPGLLISWQAETGINNKKVLHFAKDYSGIFFNKDTNSLWIVSDKSQKLFHTDLSGKVKQGFNLGIQKAEGIVVDSINQRVYIVSDSEQKLYVYSLKKR